MGGDGPSAADIVARASERDLAFIIATLGEERHARADRPRDRASSATRSPSRRRARWPTSSAVSCTRATAPFIRRRARSRRLRIFVNDELGEIAQALVAAERVLKPSGRLVVVAFHSLEDRIVKTFLTERSRRALGFAPSSRYRGAAADFPRADAAAGNAGRSRNRRQSARPFGEAARGRAHRCRCRVRPASEHLLPRLPSLADIMRGRP